MNCDSLEAEPGFFEDQHGDNLKKMNGDRHQTELLCLWSKYASVLEESHDLYWTFEKVLLDEKQCAARDLDDLRLVDEWSRNHPLYANEDIEMQCWVGRATDTALFLMPGFAIDPTGLEAALLEALRHDALRTLALSAIKERYSPDLAYVRYVGRGILDAEHVAALTAALSSLVDRRMDLWYGELVRLLILADLLARGDWVEPIYTAIADLYPAEGEHWRLTQIASGWLTEDGVFHRDRIHLCRETSLAWLQRATDAQAPGIPVAPKRADSWVNG